MRGRGQAARNVASASPNSGLVTLDICVPGTWANVAPGSAETRAGAEPLSWSSVPHRTSVDIVNAASHSGCASVKVGSYPRFSEREFKVLVTFEGAVEADVRGAFDMLATRIGARVVKREEPHRVGG